MPDIYIHQTADVSDKAVIGEGTRVWNQAQIRECAVIGKNCVISKNVYIDAYVNIGSGVKVQNNVNIYRGVTIEDDVFLGPSMTFTNDMYPRAFNKDWEITPTNVKKGASVGAGAVIRCGITIGEYAMIGAGSVVTKDVAPYSLVIGNPAGHVAWICQCGNKLDKGLHCVRCGALYNFEDGKIVCND